MRRSYENMKSEELRHLFVGVFRKPVCQKDWTIPFDYQIRRVGGEKSRKLSLIHPLTQLEFVKFYEDYDEYLLNLCSHSPYSIRYISKKAKCVFPPEEDVAETTDLAPDEVYLNLTTMR